MEKIQETFNKDLEELKLKMIQTDGKIYHVLGLEESTL